MKKDNLLGLRFGRLVVIEAAENKGKKPRWLCQCDCGKTKIVHSSSLKNGNTKSCGCFRTETTIARCSTNRSKDKTLYAVWNTIKQRCNNPNNKSYSNYGGRGITICDEWYNYDNFYEWSINNGYKHGLEIDRINNSLGYSPDNCRWVTKSVNANNKRNVKQYTINGESKSLPEWCREYNINYDTVYLRVHRLHWDVEKALVTPPIKYNRRA